LYNTEHSPDPINSTGFQLTASEHTAILMPLQKIEADLIRYIKNTLASGDYNDFGNKYGHSSDTKISNVLWLCSSLMSHSGIKIHNLTINWFTNNDQPHESTSMFYREAIMKAKDLQHLQPDFFFVPLKENFNFNHFYKHFISVISDQDETEFEDIPTEFDSKQLVKMLHKRDCRKRALTYVTFELSDNAKLSVGVYTLTSSHIVPKPITISRATKEQIVTKKGYKYARASDDPEPMNVDTEISFHEKLTAEKMVKFMVVGGDKVKFSPLEVFEMKQVMEPKIKILGFKDINSVSAFYHIRKPYFLFPNDFHIKNSTTMFRALWESCLSCNKLIIALFTMRLKTFPRLVALIPQREDETTNRFDGFRMEFMPFSGDIRNLSDHMIDSDVIDEQAVSIMEKMIKKTRFQYNPDVFKNPFITKVYNKIESTEFDEEEKDFEDSTLPNYDVIQRRTKEEVELLSEMFDGFDQELVKRKASIAKDGVPKKKVSFDINEKLVLEKCQKGDTNKLTVDILKTYLKSKNVPCSHLKKSELIAKIIELN
jgi:ATP-dependent DNA helicase 2 subunit 1